MLRLAALLLSHCALASAEYAIVNMIRHGERFSDKSNIHLAPAGFQRAEYIAKCVSNATFTMAFPLGPPDRLVASVRPPNAHGEDESVRPLETLTPLSRALSLPVENTLRYTNVDGFVDRLQKLAAGETMCVAWQHSFLDAFVRRLGLEGLAPASWPRSCNYTGPWAEPDYAMDVTEGNCYDLIWQLLLFREGPAHRWRSAAFSQMHMGFRGAGDGPCVEAFSPGSAPGMWGRAVPIAAAANSTPRHALSPAPVVFRWVAGWVVGLGGAAMALIAVARRGCKTMAWRSGKTVRMVNEAESSEAPYHAVT